MGHHEVVDLLLRHDGIDVNQADVNDVTPLYIACELGHFEVVELLLRRDDIDVCGA